jgi:hypothetical protein
MVAAQPIPLSDRVREARARIRAAGLDPAAVPHAGADTEEEFILEIAELQALGLEGDRLLYVLAGPSVPTPPEIEAVIQEAMAKRCATTT